MEKEQKVLIINKTYLELSGISKVNVINEKQINVNTVDQTLNITGENMEVLKLDVESGLLQVKGNIISLKYLQKQEKGNFIKRIFK